MLVPESTGLGSFATAAAAAKLQMDCITLCFSGSESKSRAEFKLITDLLPEPVHKPTLMYLDASPSTRSLSLALQTPSVVRPHILNGEERFYFANPYNFSPSSHYEVVTPGYFAVAVKTLGQLEEPEPLSLDLEIYLMNFIADTRKELSEVKDVLAYLHLTKCRSTGKPFQLKSNDLKEIRLAAMKHLEELYRCYERLSGEDRAEKEREHARKAREKLLSKLKESKSEELPSPPENPRKRLYVEMSETEEDEGDLEARNGKKVDKKRKREDGASTSDDASEPAKKKAKTTKNQVKTGKGSAEEEKEEEEEEEGAKDKKDSSKKKSNSSKKNNKDDAQF